MDNTVVWEFTHKQMDWQLGMSCDEQLGIPRFPLTDKNTASVSFLLS